MVHVLPSEVKNMFSPPSIRMVIMSSNIIFKKNLHCCQTIMFSFFVIFLFKRPSQDGPDVSQYMMLLYNISNSET